MSLINEIGRLIVETGQNAADKTRGISDTMKLNSMISEEERSIKNAFYQIGKKYCETFGRNPDKIFAQQVAGIRDSMEKIQTYTEQIKQIKGIVICPSCGCEVSYESPFCGDCGVPMYSIHASSGSGRNTYCGECGEIIDPSATFCMGCGSNVGQTIEPVNIAKQSPVVEESNPSALDNTTNEVCPRCKDDLTENAMFCMNCGHAVSGA